MFSGIGELARAVSAGLEEPARLMLQRGLTAINHERNL